MISSIAFLIIFQDLKKVLRENWDKIAPLFQEFDPLLKSLQTELSKLNDYIKNLETHIKEFNEIHQEPESDKVFIPNFV